jgi:UDP-N-acetylglucosamine--N-acetylmuramyl-(pentapeptide) pyrophosphoryl-undecaprenol N-acetylglucosamine transferase
MLYVGAEGEIEEMLVPRTNIPLETIKGGGLHGVRLSRFVRNLLRLGRGLFQAWRIIARFWPDVVFLTGGYVSVPVGLVAWLRRRPIVVYLPDVEPGRAIKLLSRVATRVAVNVEASARYISPQKMVVTGYPLRPEFHRVRAAGKQTAKAYFGIPDSEKVVLFFGGSRGAQRINQALGVILERVLTHVHVVHISGQLDAETCRKLRAALPEDAQARYHLFDYMHDIAQAFAAADLVVARAGAATLAEFPFFGLPAILVPYPFAWRYQKVNADYLAGRGAAIRLDDANMTEQLWPTIWELIRDEDRLQQMSANAHSLAKPDAASNLAGLLKELAQNRRFGQREKDRGRY